MEADNSVGSKRSGAKPTTPTGEKKRVVAELYLRMQQLQDEIDKLNESPKVARSMETDNTFQGVKTEATKKEATGEASQRNEGTEVGKKAAFRGKFAKIPHDGELAIRVVRLVYKVYKLRESYDEMSLLCALEAALPHELADTHDLGGDGSLMSILTELMEGFNNPTL